MMRRADISEDGKFRYSLSREWRDGLDVVWLMLNPSTADGLRDDATIRRCVGFSEQWGYGSLTVLNLFAFRATQPLGLARTPDPIGPLNDKWLKHFFRDAREIVCAWGRIPIAVDRRRMSAVLLMVPDGVRTVCLGRTHDGYPRHPVRLPYSTQREEFRR